MFRLSGGPTIYVLMPINVSKGEMHGWVDDTGAIICEFTWHEDMSREGGRGRDINPGSRWDHSSTGALSLVHLSTRVAAFGWLHHQEHNPPPLIITHHLCYQSKHHALWINWDHNIANFLIRSDVFRFLQSNFLQHFKNISASIAFTIWRYVCRMFSGNKVSSISERMNQLVINNPDGHLVSHKHT